MWQLNVHNPKYHLHPNRHSGLIHGQNDQFFRVGQQGLHPDRPQIDQSQIDPPSIRAGALLVQLT